VRCIFIGKQKVVLFPKYRENGRETAASALRPKKLVNSKIENPVLKTPATSVQRRSKKNKEKRYKRTLKAMLSQSRD
jgi:hypothetical protein